MLPGDRQLIVRSASLQRLQQEADVVVSTALHEFQGLAVMQAVAAGCVPVVPDRLAYRETYAEEFRYPSCPDDPALEAAGAAQLLSTIATQLPEVPDLSAYALTALRARYRRILCNLQDSQPQPS